MALFHFHAAQVKRSAGQSAIASAAYRAGERLYAERYGEYSDYTRKGGVVCSEILLPAHAPPEYADRQTLWNAVEHAERGKKAQLAYSFDIALQNEFSMEENIALARRFLLERFVSRGMVADFAVHQPEKDGGIQNPHFHVLCPIRPLDEHGSWGSKQRREYLLDADGNRLRDEAGHEVFNAVPTTDWGRPETLEEWRGAWADLCNERFAEKGLPVRIDHRSYARQGLEQIPTLHEGPAVRQMEARGIRTDKGDFNRWAKSANAAIRNIRQRVSALLQWLKEARAELARPQEPSLADLLNRYYARRNAGAWSQKAKLGNLKSHSAAVSYLTENRIFTLGDLEARLSDRQDALDGARTAMREKQARIKELDRLLQRVSFYTDGKPVYDKLNAIKWKKARENYKAEHEHTLHFFYLAQRELKPHFTPEGRLPISGWKKEKERLEQECREEAETCRPIREDLDSLRQIQYAIDSARHEQERSRAPSRTHTQER